MMIDVRECKICNEWYCIRSGISYHNKTCPSKNLNPNPTISEQPVDVNGTPSDPFCNIQKDPTSVQEIVNEMKEAFEKERQETLAQIAMHIDKHTETTINTIKKYLASGYVWGLVLGVVFYLNLPESVRPEITMDMRRRMLTE